MCIKDVEAPLQKQIDDLQKRIAQLEGGAPADLDGILRSALEV